MESDLPPCHIRRVYEVEKRRKQTTSADLLTSSDFFSLCSVVHFSFTIHFVPLAALSCPIDVHFRSFLVIIIEAADFQRSQLRPIAFRQ